MSDNFPNLPNVTSDHDRDDLKLLHLIWEHPAKVIGGLGVAGANLCEALKEKNGVSVKVINPSSQICDKGVNVNSYRLDLDVENAIKLQSGLENKKELLGASGSVAAFAKEVLVLQDGDPAATQCSLVHAHDWMTAAVGVHIKRSQGVPLILHVHSTQVDREGLHARGVVYEHEKWAMQQADKIIAVSDYTKEVIVEHYEVPADKIGVVRNGRTWMSDNSEFGIKEKSLKKPLVMFAGRLVGQKYPEAAVEIMAGALHKVGDARGVIAGGGDKLHAIRELVKFKGMGDRIEVLGNVPQENMHTIYADAAVLIMPSISEPFGLVAMEAACAGVAVMVSDRCGVSEMLKSAKVTELYQTDAWIDGLVELLENHELREAQAKRQFMDVRDYDWSKASDAILVIVDKLLAAK